MHRIVWPGHLVWDRTNNTSSWWLWVIYECHFCSPFSNASSYTFPYINFYLCFFQTKVNFINSQKFISPHRRHLKFIRWTAHLENLFPLPDCRELRLIRLIGFISLQTFANLTVKVCFALTWERLVILEGESPSSFWRSTSGYNDLHSWGHLIWLITSLLDF